jgi:oxygen-independent coproporphyrinogen III oxidase
MTSSALYIHFPFCKKKCSYCDFVSYAKAPSLSYIDDLIRNIELQKDQVKNLNFDTIFLGGGTPGLVPAAWLENLFNKIHKHISIAARAEISIEANPESITYENLTHYLKLGINRISIGVQSFDQIVLQNADRIHNVKQAISSIESAHRAGFDKISIDLIAGLPGESYETWNSNQKALVSLPINHLSCYFLDLSPSTPMYESIQAKQLTLPREQDLVKHYKLWVNFMESLGWLHYEISNFSLPGYACKHNQHYWLHHPYLGIGVSAVSYLPSFRFKNTVQLKRYHHYLSKGKLPAIWSEKVCGTKLINEEIMLGLRMLQHGISTDRLNKNQLSTAKIWIEKNYLSDKNNRLLLSKAGVYYANEIIASLMR